MVVVFPAPSAGRLPCPVRTDKSVDLSCGDLEGNTIHGVVITEGFVKVGCVY